MKRSYVLSAAALIFVLGATSALAGLQEKIASRVDAGLWSGTRAMDDIGTQLSFGPRVPGTIGHEKEIRFIETQLATTPVDSVKTQQWTDNDPANATSSSSGRTQRIYTNVIARFYPEKSTRIILGTHYDSIARAYADKANPNGAMPGANNSASGVALLLETARALGSLPAPPVGIDMVFFDGEEGPKSLGAGDPEWHAVGSPYFARHLIDYYPDGSPERAVIFDMVCYKNLELQPDLLSLSSAKNQLLQFWHIGSVNFPTIFQTQPLNYPINDDEDAFAKLGIPSFLVIGFKYDPWFNTTKDTLDKCAPSILTAVGNTLVKYLYAM